MVPYPTSAALKADSEYMLHPWTEPSSDCYMSLNGRWKFNWVKQPSERPAHFYKESYDVSGWDGKAVYIHFDGVYSAFHVWINGRLAGYSQGSNNDSEFDITKYVRRGTNTVAVEVVRWSDGSFLEDQDMVFLSGIHKDVGLYAAPRTGIRDLRLDSAFEGEDFSHAVLSATATVTSRSGST